MGIEVGAALLIGSALSAGGSIYASEKGSKTTGSGKAFLNALIFNQLAFDQQLSQQDQQFQQAVRQFNLFSPGITQQAARNVQLAIGEDPVARGLQGAVLADLNNQGRSPALERAFQGQLAQELASRGVLDSQRSALSSSFALLQFREQQRQQAFANAAAFSNAPGLGAQSGFAFQAPGFSPPGSLFGGASGFALNAFNSGLQARAGLAGGIGNAFGQIGQGLIDYSQARQDQIIRQENLNLLREFRGGQGSSTSPSVRSVGSGEESA